MGRMGLCIAVVGIAAVCHGVGVFCQGGGWIGIAAGGAFGSCHGRGWVVDWGFTLDLEQVSNSMSQRTLLPMLVASYSASLQGLDAGAVFGGIGWRIVGGGGFEGMQRSWVFE
jgi:hypothetical protein